MYRKEIYDIEYNNAHFKTSHNFFLYITTKTCSVIIMGLVK